MSCSKEYAASLEQTRLAFEESGNISEVARRLKLPRHTIQSHIGVLKAAGKLTKVPKVGAPKTKPKEVRSSDLVPPPKTVPAEVGTTKVFLLTAAQDNTQLLDAAFHNLKAYAGSRGGEIIVGGFTYQKRLFEENRVDSNSFDPQVEALLRPDVLDLAPSLVWYGRANILPTAVDPLAGWDTNTKEKWAIFPHAKIALKCAPVMPGRPGKQIMTTGVITRPNYVQRNAGQKAEFHHTGGATIAEVRPDGTFFVRQITFAPDGSFQDLDVVVRDGKIKKGVPVEAITWGDVHLEYIDEAVARVLWGYDATRRLCAQSGPSMLDDLKPKYQFFHDSFDFTARSHHTRDDPHQRLMRIEESNNDINAMLINTARFLRETRREWCRSVHVASNHNIHLDKWLKDVDGHFDAVNAQVYHELNAAWFKSIRDGDETFQAYVYGLQRAANLDGIVFLREGESFVVCQGIRNIECGLHGHVGARGGKGSPAAMAKMVESVNVGHTHEPRILEGAYYAGTSSIIPMPYAAKGPNAWHHSEIITYGNGKRTIVTVQNGAYRA